MQKKSAQPTSNSRLNISHVPNISVPPNVADAVPQLGRGIGNGRCIDLDFGTSVPEKRDALKKIAAKVMCYLSLICIYIKVFSIVHPE